MTQPKFTPGPWIAEHQGLESTNAYAILTEKGWGEGNPWLANMHGQNVGPKLESETEANATLIAAAPDMYAALVDARQYVVRAYECAFPDAEANTEVLAAIDAALAKAGRA